jgi:hypothetical protein
MAQFVVFWLAFVVAAIVMELIATICGTTPQIVAICIVAGWVPAYAGLRVLRHLRANRNVGLIRR